MLNRNFVSPSRVRLLRVAGDAAPDIAVVNEALQHLAQLTPDGLIALSEASQLDSWLPSDADPDDPLWVIALPAMAQEDLLQVAQRPPAPVNRLTTDMLHSRMFVEWNTPNFTISATDACVESMGVSEASFIYMLFVTPKHAILASMPQDEDFVISLQGTAISSGRNYRPYRIWSDEELADGAKITRTSLGGNSYFGNEERLIQLHTFRRKEDMQ